MNADNIIGLVVSIALIAYLVAALIRPEKF
ncbi:K(+)-transporting ATPase subunit F [Streptacidiphilus sp. MAP5-3]